MLGAPKHRWSLDIYVGDGANTQTGRENARQFANMNGREIVFVVDKNNQRYLCHYISKKFYPSINNIIHPAWGKYTL